MDLKVFKHTSYLIYKFDSLKSYFRTAITFTVI